MRVVTYVASNVLNLPSKNALVGGLERARNEFEGNKKKNNKLNVYRIFSYKLVE